MRLTQCVRLLAFSTLTFCAGPHLRAQTVHSAPVVSLAPHNPGSVNTDLGAATLSFSTPAYVSMDQPRSAGLVYNSTQAQGIGFVQVDATDNSSPAPAKMSIQVYNSSGAVVSPETFYQAAAGANRLAAKWVTTTSANVYRVVVRSYWSDGSVQSAEVQTRVIVLDERTSVLGAGWTLVGAQRLTSASDGALVSNGDGTAIFFSRICPTCPYQSPDGEFSTLVKNTDSTWVRAYPDGTKAYFDTYGLISRYEDRVGNRTTFDWNWAPDGRRQPHAIFDPMGKMILLSYNPTTGMLSSIADPAGRATTITITGGDLTEVTGADNRRQALVSVDASHRLSYWLDAAGGRWDVAYDAVGGLASITAPQVSTTDAGLTRPVVQTKSLWSTVLPALGLGSSASPATRVDPAAVRVTSIDARGNVVRSAVDRFGAPTRVEEPYGRVTLIDRNQHSQVTRTVAPSGHTVTETWSGPDLTRMVDETLHDTATAAYEPTYHQVTYLHHSLQNDSVYYGANGLADSAVIRGDTRTVMHYSYDRWGRLTAEIDPRGHGMLYAYDGNPGGTGGSGNLSYSGIDVLHGTSISFDAAGRDTITTSPTNDVAHTAYDVMNRVVRTVGPRTDTTAFAFDSLGLSTVTDAKHQVYRYTRNAVGWVVSETDPRNASIAYAYDRAGSLTGVTNRRGQTVAMTYDSLNRISTRDADLARTTWTYDPAEHWAQVTNPLGSERAEYDSAGLPLRQYSTIDGITYRVESAYSTSGLRTLLSAYGPWSGVRTLRYHYDARERLDSITDFSGARSAVGYDADGLRNGTTLPNGTRLQRDYMGLHVPSEISQAGLGMSDALYQQYEVNASGLVSSRTMRFHDSSTGFTGNQVRLYTYDRAGELTLVENRKYYDEQWNCQTPGQEQNPDGSPCVPAGGYEAISSHQWTWDLVGNPAVTTTSTVQTGNRLTRLGNLSMEYDADGNLARKYRNDGVTWEQRLYWNSLGQLDSATTNGVTKRYAYNGLGQRVRERSGTAAASYFLYDGDDLLMTLGPTGTPILKFSYFPGVDNPHSFTSEATGATYYYESDHPGNVVGLISTAGRTVAKYDYDPFGASTIVFDSAGYASQQPLRFLAREMDETAGLVYMRNRWYDVALERFISEDPLGLGADINPFRFDQNSPSNLWDPSGLAPSVKGGCVGELLELGFTIEGAKKRCSTTIQLLGLIAQAPGGDRVLQRLQEWVEENRPLAAFGVGSGVSSTTQTTVHVLECTGDKVGSPGLGAGVIMTSLSQEAVPKAVQISGASRGTSVASQWLSETFPQRLPGRIWAPTWNNPGAQTRTLGRALGRWAPWVGWALIAMDAVSLGRCIAS